MSRALPKLDTFQQLNGFHWKDEPFLAADMRLKATDHPQIIKLNAMIAQALAAQSQATKGMLFASPEGRALVNAMFDLTECNELYELADQVSAEIGDPEWREKL